MRRHAPRPASTSCCAGSDRKQSLSGSKERAMAMERLFQLMKEKNASDMFFAVNSPVHIKINGNLIPINQHKLEPENIQSLLSEVASAEEMATLERENELNMGISVPNLGRFRLSAFRQRGTISAVFRFVPAT